MKQASLLGAGFVEEEPNLQREAVGVFGMDVQLQHAIEELTELSLEVQRNLRARRSGCEWFDPVQLGSEFCDGVNALKTIRMFLEEYCGMGPTLPQMQAAKNRKFAQHIEDGKRKENER